MTEAKGRLENFSLSRFQNGSLPANYIPADNDLPPAFADQAGRVHEFQRSRIKEHLGKLAEAHEAHIRKRGRAPATVMTVAIHKERIASVRPSYHEGKRTVGLLGERGGLERTSP